MLNQTERRFSKRTAAYGACCAPRFLISLVNRNASASRYSCFWVQVILQFIRTYSKKAPRRIVLKILVVELWKIWLMIVGGASNEKMSSHVGKRIAVVGCKSGIDNHWGFIRLSPVCEHNFFSSHLPDDVTRQVKSENIMVYRADVAPFVVNRTR